MPASHAEKASRKIGRVVIVGSWVFVENIAIAENRASIMASMQSRAETR